MTASHLEQLSLHGHIHCIKDNFESAQVCRTHGRPPLVRVHPNGGCIHQDMSLYLPCRHQQN